MGLARTFPRLIWSRRQRTSGSPIRLAQQNRLRGVRISEMASTLRRLKWLQSLSLEGFWLQAISPANSLDCPLLLLRLPPRHCTQLHIFELRNHLTRVS